MSCSEELAACLCIIFGIPHDHAKQMSARQVRSLAEFDHYPIRKSEDGPYVHWNLMPRLRAHHRLKTRTDVAEIAKGKRIKRKFEEHRERMRQKWK